MWVSSWQTFFKLTCDESRPTLQGTSANFFSDLDACLFECISWGERVAYASNSKKDIKKLEIALTHQFPNLGIKAIHADNISEENKDFLNHINDRLDGVDCLLYSPTIGTGVSIEAEHFDRVFLCGVGNTTLPTDLYQQQGRIRHHRSKQIEYWVEERLSLRPRDRAWIESAFAQAEQFTSGALLTTGNERQVWFSDLWSAVKSEEARGLVHLSEFFDYRVRQDGHTIDDDSPQSQNSLAIAGERSKFSAAQLKLRRLSGICLAQDLTPNLYRQLHDLLEATGFLPLERHWELERYRIKMFYGQEVTPDLVAADREGKLRLEIKQYEQYHATDDELIELDELERDWYREHEHHHRLQHNLYHSLFKSAGIEDLACGKEHEFIVSQLGEFSKLAKRYSRSLYAACKLIVPRDIDKNPVQFLGIMLRKMGLKLTHEQRRVSRLVVGKALINKSASSDTRRTDNRTRFHCIEPENASKMKKWYDSRQKVAQTMKEVSNLVHQVAQSLGLLPLSVIGYLSEAVGHVRITGEAWLEPLYDDALILLVHNWERRQ